MKKSTVGIIVGIVVVVVLPMGYYFYDMFTPGKLDSFAGCLKEKGVLFYGAFWCPHCQEQKALFGRSADKLPYTECSAPNGKDQLAVCEDAGIKSYPTWILQNGEILNGSQTLETLSEKTGCELPL